MNLLAVPSECTSPATSVPLTAIVADEVLTFMRGSSPGALAIDPVTNITAPLTTEAVIVSVFAVSLKVNSSSFMLALAPREKRDSSIMAIPALPSPLVVIMSP